jgi:glycosyltransferase involved in cell wall biosynthesis
MRIGINAILIHRARFGGAETYARKLLDELPAIDRENEYLVFTGEDSGLSLSAPNFRHIQLRAPLENPYTRVLWEQLALPRILKSHRLDLAHFPGTTAPIFFSGRSIVTIHETLRFQVPQLTPTVIGAYYAWTQRRIAQRGDFVISVSQADAAVMARGLGLDRQRIAVVPLGVSEDFFTPPSPKQQFALWAGHFYPHKNVEVLFDAYAELRRRGNLPIALRMIGADEGDRRRLRPLLEARNIADLISLEERVSHAELPAIFAGASLFLFPSKCESFGLPLIEAMASGTAVICSDLPALREVCGDVATYCDPDSPIAFADAISRLTEDKAQRQAFEARGREHARRFTWRRCAEKTLEAYERALA